MPSSSKNPRNARPIKLAESPANSRHANETAVRNTPNHNVPSPEAFSSRSPTVAAARSGLVTKDRIHSASWALRMCCPRKLQAFHQPLIRTLCASNAFDAFRADAEKPLGPASTLRSRITKLGPDQALLLQA